MRVALIFDKLRVDTLGGYLERACQAEGIAYDHFWLRDAASRPLNGYDVYVRVDHGDYREDLPATLHPKVFYASDTHLPKPWRKIRRLAAHYDLVCCVHRQGAAALPNGVWVPVGCDVGYHGRQALPIQFDVAFVGTDGGVPRKFYLQAIRERFPRSVIGLAPHTQIGAIYSQAKIGFNYSIRDDINMRMFEILCAGTCLLTNRLRHDDLACVGLVEERHYVTYRDPRHLWSQLEYYLSHDDQREAIAHEGMEHAQRHHTYRHRLRAILQAAAERIPGLPRVMTQG